MPFDGSTSPGGTTTQTARYLVGNEPLVIPGLSDCTSATTLVGYSQDLEETVIIGITCKRWGCRFCGQAKIRKLAAIATEAKPTSLVTLTVDPALHENPRHAYDQTRRKVATLSQQLRKAYGEFEYLRVLEITKKGWPHYHLVSRCPYIPQAAISTVWATLTGAPIVDIRKIKRTQDVYYYVIKYLSKQHYIRWTDRRVTMSRHFDLTSKVEREDRLHLIVTERHNYHPAAYLWHNYHGYFIEQIGPLVFVTRGRGKIQQSLSET
jgi:hypothetical protein